MKNLDKHEKILLTIELIILSIILFAGLGYILILLFLQGLPINSGSINWTIPTILIKIFAYFFVVSILIAILQHYLIKMRREKNETTV